jgi:hypothetical protein
VTAVGGWSHPGGWVRFIGAGPSRGLLTFGRSIGTQSEERCHRETASAHHPRLGTSGLDLPPVPLCAGGLDEAETW